MTHIWGRKAGIRCRNVCVQPTSLETATDDLFFLGPMLALANPDASPYEPAAFSHFFFMGWLESGGGAAREDTTNNVTRRNIRGATIRMQGYNL